MKITKRQLRRIIKEAIDKDFFVDREANPHDGGMYGEPEGGWVDDPAAMGRSQWMGAEEDKSVEVWEAVQQNVEEPSFAAWLGKELGSGPDPEYVMDAVQQNLNNQDFVAWLYDELGLGG